MMRLRRTAHRPPLAGAAAVFRYRLRSARPVNAALTAGGLLLAIGAVTLALGLSGERHSAGMAGTLRAALTQAVVAEALVLSAAGAVLGAGAAPAREAEEEIQSALAAGVSPIGLCAGRLLAALVAPACALVVACLGWLGTQAMYGLQPREQGGSAAIFVAHVILLCAVLMSGTIGHLFALKRRPGRETWRGIAAGILLTVLGVGGLFLASAQIRSAENPVPLINGLLLINPVAAAESALGRDLLRWSWVYERAPAADYEFAYPSPAAACGVYMGIAVAALALSAVRLRRAYR